MDSGSPLGKTLRRWAAGLLHAEDPARKASSDVPILPAPEELDLLLEDVVSTTGVPGAALSVVVDGETVSAAAGVRSVDGYFPLDESALFEPLGLTKLAVGGVVHELAGAGTLDLDDPVVRWLPELGGAGDGILVAHLLSHTSGYVGENPANLDKVFRYPWDEFAAFFRGTPRAHAPGTAFGLVESEYAVLGEVVRRAAGAGVLDLAGEMFFGRLPPEPADHDPETAGRTVPGHLPFEGAFTAVEPVRPCGFWAPSLLAPAMTTGRMARLAELLLVRPASPCRSPALAERAVRLPAQLRGAHCAEVPEWFGLGCGGFGAGVLGLSTEGMGQCGAVRALPERGVALAAALNCQAPRVRDDLVAEVLGIVADVDPPTAPGRIDLDRPADEFVGVYRAAHWQTLEVSRDGGQLRVANGYNPWLPVERTAEAATLEIPDPRTCALAAGSEDWSLGFFADPSDGRPCLMAGLSAFARME